MVQVMHVDPVTHRAAVGALFTEYLAWLNDSLFMARPLDSL